MSLLDKDYDFELDEWKVKIKHYFDKHLPDVSKQLKLENIFINLSEDFEEASWLYWRFDLNNELHVYLCFMDLGGAICNDGTMWRPVISQVGAQAVHYVTDDMILKCWGESV